MLIIDERKILTDERNLTWQNHGQLFVAQELIKNTKLLCCGIQENKKVRHNSNIA